MKVKAFSKEGLQAPQKDNPQERAKTEMRDKVNQHVEQLETQVATLLEHTFAFKSPLMVGDCVCTTTAYIREAAGVVYVAM